MRALLAPTARVLRDGHVRERPADELVRRRRRRAGAGDRVPADGRLVEATLLQVDESALTGESLPRSKRADPPDPADAPLAERHTSVLAGTTVARGARALRRHGHRRRDGDGPDRRRGGPRPRAGRRSRPGWTISPSC